MSEFWFWIFGGVVIIIAAAAFAIFIALAGSKYLWPIIRPWFKGENKPVQKRTRKDKQ